jgi:hypothetical protein
MDARGWIGLGCWTLTVLILGMILFERSLLDSDAFLILATAIVITGWVQGPVSWAYAATKQGGELAEQNSVMLQQQQPSHADTVEVTGENVSVEQRG